MGGGGAGGGEGGGGEELWGGGEGGAAGPGGRKGGGGGDPSPAAGGGPGGGGGRARVIFGISPGGHVGGQVRWCGQAVRIAYRTRETRDGAGKESLHFRTLEIPLDPRRPGGKEEGEAVGLSPNIPHAEPPRRGRREIPMKMTKTRGAAALSALALATAAGQAGPFGPGTLIVVRGGDGAAGLARNATAVFIDERSPVDGSLIQSIALPVVAGGLQG